METVVIEPVECSTMESTNDGKSWKSSTISKWHFSKLESTPSSPSSPSTSKYAPCSIAFVIIAFFQMLTVVTIQGLILANGGDGRRLINFTSCLNAELQIAIECSNWSNITIPSFGKDKPVFVGFIIALTVYNALLCCYALFGKHFLELISFLVVNVLTICYAAFEAWQFRPFGPNCKDLPVAGQLAVGSTAVLLVFTVLFVCMSLYMYRDFGWKVYKDVDCNHQMRKYYQWYEAVSSGVKLLILFTVVFCLAQLAILLTPDNYEFVLTIILVVVSIVGYFVVQLTVRYNSFPGYLAIAFAGVLLIVYHIFKITRLWTKSCPVCHEQENSLIAEYNELDCLLKTCTNNSSATLDRDYRSIQFENLIIFASVNLVTTIVILAIFIHVWCYLPGSKLKEHFAKHPYWISKLLCYQYTGGSDRGRIIGVKDQEKKY